MRGQLSFRREGGQRTPGDLLFFRRVKGWYRQVFSLGRWLILVILVVEMLGWGAAMPQPGFSQVATEDLVSQSLEELQKKQETLDQQRTELEQQQNDLKTRQSVSEDKLDGLQRTIVATNHQIAETEYRLAKAQKELEDLRAKLQQAQAEYDQMQKATVARLQFLQRQQGSEGWAVLLYSEDFNEFLDRRYQLRRVYEADKSVLDDLKRKAEEIKRQQVVIEEQKNQVALLRQQLLAQKQQYEAEAQEEQKLITRLKDRREALEAAEAQLARDSEKVGALIREKVAASTGVIRGTGRFVFPVNARLTSGFGSRVHPILGYRRFHAGVDFGASHGSTIHAADTGRVIFSGWYGGYGQAVIIDHGGGLTTLYAHASRLFVREGQGVKQGDPIAAVGSTGLSTGPHLHFEVRQNGSPINPMAYL